MSSGLEITICEGEFLVVTPEILERIKAGEISYTQLAKMIDELKKENDQLREQVFIDPLTGILNRNGFHNSAIPLIANAIRHNEPFSLGYFDFNFFKELNDFYGHAIGDECLSSTGDIFKKGLRQEDLFARFGGDEFVILFQGTDVIGARNALSRIIRESYPSKIPLTLSVGLSDSKKAIEYFKNDSKKATLPRDILETMLDHGDRLMYKAKGQKGTCESPKNVLAYDSPETENLIFEHF
jgi:two-component system, cell cycle response regulator